MNSDSNGALLSRILLDLKNKNEETRSKASLELHNLVTSVSREVTGETFTKFINDVNRRIFDLIHSTEQADKISGILAIDRLIDFDGEENSTKVTRFANYLRVVLPGNAADSMTTLLASKTLGHLALSGSNSSHTQEFVEFEVKRALEWLQGDKNEAKRYSAVLVLKELCTCAPTLLYVYVPQIIEVIWPAFRDSKVLVREGAADALNACLELVNQRDNQLKRQWFRKIFDEVTRGFKINSSDSIHGSLLTLRELLRHAKLFSDAKYPEISELILKHKDNKEMQVRKTVISLMPVLATFDLDTFVSMHLNLIMSHLLTQLKKDKDRSYVFIAIGKISIAVGCNISQYLDSILQHIKEGLTSKTKSSRTNSPQHQELPIFQCISMLAKAVGPALTKYMHELLDHMFASGLTQTLHNTLVDLTGRIPPLLPNIQERLLHLLYSILCSQSYVRKNHQGSGSLYRSGSNSSSNMLLRGSGTGDFAKSTAEGGNVDVIILALSTLGSFDFTGNSYIDLICTCALSYLDDDNANVRKAAATTCCTLLGMDSICYKTDAQSMDLVGGVIERLLTVGITDPESVIRIKVLSLLDEKFDFHLCQPENIRYLFISLNDEIFAIRQLTVGIIGRLSNQNPADIMPALRKVLIQLLTEIEYSGSSKQKEEGAQLFCTLISRSKKLIRPYAEAIMKVLIPKANDSSPPVASKILEAIGELCHIGGEELLPYINIVLPLIIETLQDPSSSTRREASLKALRQISSSTGFVIDPYTNYPNLLNILINILKTDQSAAIKLETKKVMGTLGALDPYKHKIAVRESDEAAIALENDLILSGIGPSNDDYYPSVALTALIRILKDFSLSVHHTAVVQAIMYIFKTLGLQCVQFLPQLIPPLLNMMRTCPSGMLEFHFQQLGVLVSIVKDEVRNYIVDIFALIQEFWNPSSSIQITILSLVEAIAISLESEFKIYLLTLLPDILQTFETDNTDRRLPSHKVLQVLVVFDANLEEFLHLVVPALIGLVERADTPINLKKVAIQTIGLLCRKINFSDHASRIILPLLRLFNNNVTTQHGNSLSPSVGVNLGSSSGSISTAASTQVLDIKSVVMDTICCLIYQMTSDFIIFVPMINKILMKYHFQHAKYSTLVGKLLKGEQLPQEVSADPTVGAVSNTSSEMASKKLPVNQQNLKKSWEASSKLSKDDWNDWIRRFSVELLKESPSHALRACSSLAGIHYPLARELFNAGFVSCWGELYDQFQDELVRSLETALTCPTTPPEIQQAVLNLAEFMEHDEKALPINIRTLGVYAAKCQAYAKALHYKELEFISEPSPQVYEALISINHLLQQPDSAIGILTNVQQHHDIELKESWYEKLNRWDDGLAAYERKQAEDPSSVDAILGQMRCLQHLGEWEALSFIAQERWNVSKDEVKKTIAPMAAAAAWGLGQWELMDQYITVMKNDSPDSSFFRAILALHRNLFPQAKIFIDKTRDLVDTELMALIGESYNRAYWPVVRIQMIAEMEEIIDYKQAYDEPERQAVVRRTWMTRLKGCQRNVEVWQRILKVRTLVTSPKEDKTMWIKFSSLCRKSGRIGLSAKTLSNLLDVPCSDMAQLDIVNNDPYLVYACLKHLWASGSKDVAFKQMKAFTKHLVDLLGTSTSKEVLRSTKAETDNLPSLKLLARCFLKVGDWQVAVQEEFNSTVIPQILRSYSSATQYDSDWYKAWHAWAFANFEVVAFYEKSPKKTTTSVTVSHVVSSIEGFFRSISLSQDNSLQDTLRLLTLWFKFGKHSDVNIAIGEGFKNVSVDTWLQVIPQLIARVHTSSAQVRKLIHQLLSEVGKIHPQALVYSITVASKSQNISRKKAALAIIDNMRIHSAELVEQSLLVSQELIRVAILWHELWHEGLEEASRQYFADKNIEGMLAALEPLHVILEGGPETLQEVSFNQYFGANLQEALDWCNRYKRTLNQADLDQAWDLYYLVFRAINKQLPLLTSLDLQYVSPKLLAARDLQLAVPGTYKSGEANIKISSFATTLTVITSKQRPRKLSIKGSDGKNYQYLLKGHEDLRTDERVMQLFGLVNTLLSTDPETFKRHLNITRYPVIPLSHMSGLIGWVPHCDTLHSLIVDYREKRKILVNIEHRMMLQMSPDYEKLSVLQKVEVFENALSNSNGQDLYKVLWLKSKNSEVWLDRRTTYTRSLAVMSMVGYILGLGDRHPSNLMLERLTGKIIHIDFGDCFEVAMHRDKFPEKIPFRLTRMLVKAMEVSGIEGNYRITCENVMRVLRENKDSVMAVLEAFIHDPLINWRLLNNPSGAKIGERNNDQEGELWEEPRKLGGTKNYRSEDFLNVDDDESHLAERNSNSRALSVILRVSNKLTGRDFKPDKTLDVKNQVNLLIEQATSVENLCQCWVGWCSFW